MCFRILKGCVFVFCRGVAAYFAGTWGRVLQGRGGGFCRDVAASLHASLAATSSHARRLDALEPICYKTPSRPAHSEDFCDYVRALIPQ